MRSQGGFSLIETLCAVMILGIGLTGLTTGITAALTANKEVEQQGTAAWLAAERIELLRADGYWETGLETGEYTGPFTPYQWRQEIEEMEPEGLYRVTVTIELSVSEAPVYQLTTLLFDAPLPPLSSGLSDPSSTSGKKASPR